MLKCIHRPEIRRVCCSLEKYDSEDWSWTRSQAKGHLSGSGTRIMEWALTQTVAFLPALLIILFVFCFGRGRPSTHKSSRTRFVGDSNDATLSCHLPGWLVFCNRIKKEVTIYHELQQDTSNQVHVYESKDWMKRTCASYVRCNCKCSGTAVTIHFRQRQREHCWRCTQMKNESLGSVLWIFIVPTVFFYFQIFSSTVFFLLSNGFCGGVQKCVSMRRREASMKWG